MNGEQLKSYPGLTRDETLEYELLGMLSLEGAMRHQVERFWELRKKILDKINE